MFISTQPLVEILDKDLILVLVALGLSLFTFFLKELSQKLWIHSNIVQLFFVVFLNYFVTLSPYFCQGFDGLLILSYIFCTSQSADFGHRLIGVNDWESYLLDYMFIKLVVNGPDSERFSPETIIRRSPLQFAELVVDDLAWESWVLDHQSC